MNYAIYIFYLNSRGGRRPWTAATRCNALLQRNVQGWKKRLHARAWIAWDRKTLPSDCSKKVFRRWPNSSACVCTQPELGRALSARNRHIWELPRNCIAPMKQVPVQLSSSALSLTHRF